MYTSRIVRDEKGHIVKGSVLKASDRVDQQMARIAPDRRWFGNTRVIGQETLQKFRKEMSAKYRDPYSVIIKQSKLPLSLLETGTKEGGSVRNLMEWDRTFGNKASRKRIRLDSIDINDFAKKAQFRNSEYSTEKVNQDRNLVREGCTERDDRSKNQGLFKKGQSNRIWNELYKVIDSSDVVLYVLDARDPMGTRSHYIEEYMRKEKKYKHFVFILNKCDLIPLWATARWLQVLSKDYPTVAFHASVNHPFGKGSVISLLRQFSRLQNVTHRGSKRTKTPISVGIIGYPNVGKSSLINTLRRKTVCKVAPIPGETKVWQYVALTRNIFLIDCPGVIYDRESNNDVQAVLKGVVRVERLGNADKTDVVSTVLEIVKKKDIVVSYGVSEWNDVNDFLKRLAKLRGKLLTGGEPDTETVARMVLYDWQRGRIPWFNAPSFDTNKHYREALKLPEANHMKIIEHYNTFNIVDGAIGHDSETIVPEFGTESNRPSTGKILSHAEGIVHYKKPDVNATVATFTLQKETAKKGGRRRARTPVFELSTDLPKENNDETLWKRFISAAKA
ncbi:GTP-binding protein, putative [Trypanosoma vivax Y486]|uniref:Nucleolar GTP-binding protein 2 n=1 Tax=Trypanosoma vivax (strain Y486) TaxID=1055687 RepID=F9WUY6_TRYVY|nr:GTP-binding protein, putative [Trypanosoma vivax Y486]|eukprot:CCD21386.1 GTP-binding protein, putative [Trypanosoma vivax Y486]